MVFEEFQKQEKLLQTFKVEFKKLKASDEKNQILIKQFQQMTEENKQPQIKASHKSNHSKQ